MEVVSASHGVLGPLVGKLTSFLADECGRLKGVRREIRYLRSELTSMHAALSKYTELEDPNVQVKTWISLVRELAYDTEDCFDKFIHQLGNSGDHKGFNAFIRKAAHSFKTLWSRYEIADQIDELKARIKQVKELKDSYKIEDSTSFGTVRPAAIDPRLHAFFVEESQLVGIDDPRDDLVKWMLKEGNNSSQRHRKVLSIVGFGGLGKTTLANEVYRKIKGNFRYKAFVSVSQKPVIKRIIKDIIHKITYPDGFTRDIDIWDEMTSIEKLRELLREKSYLVIIDDIWSTSAWNAIKCAFPENNYSSRIVVTTRIVEVAKSCCPSDDDRMYEMKALRDLYSRRLFFKRIFGSEDRCPEMMKEVSNKILKKCGGLPLAIISISGLLSNRSITTEEWRKINRSIGSALEKNQSLDGMNNILSLSYNDLPSNLKTCLLYLSNFPEDYIIDRERLLRRWIAEGFISEERGLSQQEVAEKYFYELINKSMIQPDCIEDDRKVRNFRVHDMMLELIISKSTEANFVTVVGSGKTCLANRQGFIRRLSVHDIDQELASALGKEDLSHVRSLTVTSSSCIKHLPNLDKFEVLRVLDFEDCSEGVEEYVRSGIDKLFQLKYLGLARTKISKLPPGIVKLHHLETLDLWDTSVQELPPGIIQLIKLQHLISYVYYKIPDGIENMSSLHEVPCFDITGSSVDAVEGLGNLTRLNALSVRFEDEGSDKYKRHAEVLLSSIRKLATSCKLQSLQIEGSGGSLEFLECLSPLPSSLQQFLMNDNYYFKDIQKKIVPAALTSLAVLDINATELTEECLQTLGELPALLSLRLKFKTGPKERLIFQGIGFPNLKNFWLYSRNNTAYITFAGGTMLKLEILDLSFLVLPAKTDGFYLGIEHLPCLIFVSVLLNNKGAISSDSQAAAAALRKEVGAHPNHPRISITQNSMKRTMKRVKVMRIKMVIPGTNLNRYSSPSAIKRFETV